MFERSPPHLSHVGAGASLSYRIGGYNVPMRNEIADSRALSRLLHLAARNERSAGSQHWSRFLGFGAQRAADLDWRAALAALAPVSLLTIVGFWIEPIIRGPNLANLYMLAVVFTALRWGRRAAIVSAVSGALMFDYFFVPPYRSFTTSDVWYLITLIGLLSVGLLVSMLTLAAREEAAAARIREVQTAALYSLTKSLAAEYDLDQILRVIGRHMFETFQVPVVIWMPGDGRLAIRYCDEKFAPNEVTRVAAEWAFESGLAAGCGTAKFSGSRVYCLPLKTWRGAEGVLGVRVDNAKEWLAPPLRPLLETFANQAALAITRAALAKEAQRIEVLQEADKLQKALLNSISHNLRTPLSSVTGVLNTVLEDGALLDASTQRELLKTAQEEARRLNQLLQNLLDMTRLEGGILRLKTEPHDVQDAVGAAMEQLAAVAQQRPITITIPPNLPLVPMDFVLIVQVLVNLLDNALKYSPIETPIEVEATLDVDRVQIRVADSGKGIPEQYLERVFEKFFRAAPAETPGGAGLGLSICKGLVEAHRGRIWAQLRTQGGTEVIFSLPL